MVKYLLVLHVCSFLTQTCPGMINPRGLHDTWLECANEGYRQSAIIMKNYDPKVINDNKIAIKFECKEITQETT